ncbi:MAG: isochorismatase family protein, partial [Streptococcus mitis]|nr:isochorismatase family protein [Streptococcus mitis]MDU6724474.1 isochorismatase family protein [Streptococcus mitis]
DSHMRELIELGYNVIVVNDAVGAPGEEAYQAALTNYGYIANQVLTTEEVIAQL